MKKRLFFAIRICTVLIIFTSIGCVSYPQKRSFMLSAAREAAVRSYLTDTPLLVSRFRVAPQYESKGFVYKKGEINYESDYYNEFLALPGAMISEEIRKWMVMSGLFRFVADSPNIDSSHYRMEGSVGSLYGDYNQGKTPSAVLQLGISLLKKDGEDSKMVFQKTYDRRTSMQGDGPDALIKGFNEALKSILTALESDLVKSGLN